MADTGVGLRSESLAKRTARPAVPDYQLLRRIGAGAYGEVWLARSILGAYRAVKVVYRRQFEDQRPFDREFNGIQKFEPVSRSHSSQVAILHVGRSDDYFYYVMELADDLNGEGKLESASAQSPAQFELPTRQAAMRAADSLQPESYVPTTLKNLLARRGRLSCEESLRVALSLSTALEHLHQHDLIHRDIKPSNIIFVEGIPKLADIGLVASRDATLSFVGTEGFVPPEGPGTPQADIYSLGKVLYEMCTGRDRHEFPELPTQLRADPEREALVELNEIVLKACERDPAKRYQSAKEMHAELAMLQAGRSVRLAHGLERRLTQAKRFAVVALVVAALAILWTRQSKRTERLALEQVHQLHVAQGVQLIDEGDYFGGILWFATALNLADQQSARHKIDRLRIGTTLSFSPQLVQMFFHEDMVRKAAFSPNGDRIATASDDGTARVWDVATGEPLIPALGHESEVRDVEFSPDGRWVVTASNDFTARVWDAATGQPISPPLRHSNYVYAANFHPAGLIVATASEDRTAQLWNARTGERMGKTVRHNDRIMHVRFSPNGTKLATTSRDCTANIWRVEDVLNGTGSPLILQHQGEVQDIAFSEDSLRVVTGSADKSARIWDVNTGTALTGPLQHSDEVWCVAFSGDGRYIASGSKDRTARIWTSAGGELVAPPLSHKGNLRSVAFSPDSTLLVTASSDRTARVWQVANGRPSTPSLPHASNLHGAVFDPTGKKVLTASRDGTARLWILAERERTETRLQFSSQVFPVAFSPEARYLAVHEWRPLEDVTLWQLDGPAPEQIHIPKKQAGPRISSAFSPDGKYLAVSSMGVTNVMEVFQLETRRLVAELGSRNLRPIFAARCTRFSPDGKWLFWADENSGGHDVWAPADVRGWDTSTFREYYLPALCSERPTWISFSPDSRALVICWGNPAKKIGFAQIWDIATAQPLGPSIFHAGAVSRAEFSPDGKRLVTGFGDAGLGPCEAQVWDPFTGTRIAPPIRHRDGVSSVSFSQDGKWVLTSSEDGTARVWNSFTSEPRTPPLAHDAAVQWAEFNASSELVVTASYDGTARVWDARTGQPVTPPLKHDGPVWHAVFSHDARRIASGAEDRTARIWNLTEDTRQPRALRDLAELLAAQRIDATGGVVPITLDEMRTRWQAIRGLQAD
jgi:WD40 repeat protein